MIGSATEILLSREAYHPATLGEMYDPDRTAGEFPRLQAALERNDEIVERIYIGRRFRNDTERLEKLFALYALDEKPSKQTSLSKNFS